MGEKTQKDYEKLLAHWNSAFAMTEEDKAEARQAIGEEDWKEMAPAVKLLDAAASLGSCQNALDLGCGSGWASIAMAKHGCAAVTCTDPAQNAAEMAAFYAEVFGVKDQVHPLCTPDTWLSEQPDGSYDGLFCSNVLDVVPTEMAESILKNAARVLKKGAPVVIGLNFYMEPEAAQKRGLEFEEGNLLYIGGVLRMVSRTDEEWAEILGRHFRIEKLEHFAWPGEETEKRRLFYLRAV